MKNDELNNLCVELGFELDRLYNGFGSGMYDSDILRHISGILTKQAQILEILKDKLLKEQADRAEQKQ